ncbi:MAG TPA: AmmeMemoRadiSam system protein A [Cyanobacteria bacterium UBA8530]|nr:AmmeMemoRadiSam system protein A [Cyanobacteria bacterium UBA8530]
MKEEIIPFDPAGYARRVLESHLKCLPLPEPPENFPERAAGCFVSIKKQGELRGCIGTILPTAPSLGQEIKRNALAAALEDPRFPRVEPLELPLLTFSVDVLGALERVTQLEQLDPRCYGVVVSAKGRRGLLLPDLEGVDTVEGQLAIAMRKAGIPHDTPIDIERFRVDRFLETP